MRRLCAACRDAVHVHVEGGRCRSPAGLDGLQSSLLAHLAQRRGENPRVGRLDVSARLQPALQTSMVDQQDAVLPRRQHEGARGDVTRVEPVASERIAATGQQLECALSVGRLHGVVGQVADEHLSQAVATFRHGSGSDRGLHIGRGNIVAPAEGPGSASWEFRLKPMSHLSLSVWVCSGPAPSRVAAREDFESLVLTSRRGACLLIRGSAKRVSPSDESLVRQTLAGSLRSFEQLMRRYEKLVCKVAHGYVRDLDRALDVTQDVFLKVYRNLDRVQSGDMFKPWLLRITYNESINSLRRQRRHDGALDLAEHENLQESSPDQEHRLLAGEAKRKVVDALRELSPKYRLAVALRYADGMRVREIAEVMECSEGVVKSLLFRGVRQLRDRVAG
jgi:RNA polymerase sigma-70 factor (ECF subfamily)